MMASAVLAYLEGLRVRLTLTPEGVLHYRAPKGAMTSVLWGTVKSCQVPLTMLLTTGVDGDLPKGVSFPETDYSRFVTWQTGKVPASAQFMMAPLLAPKYHDVPSVPETVLGRPCPKTACKPDAVLTNGKPANMYYRRTRLCVACYDRLQKQRTKKSGETQETEG
jgi:hypothetical protein